MQILAISGSTRRASTNTSLLHQLARIARPGTSIKVYDRLTDLPIFSPAHEADPPATVRAFISQIETADGVIISSPEYVHAIPGGLKNAIDWLVSGEAIINKPIALIHASHRGDDMLASLRLVLGTVSTAFNDQIFARFALVSKSPDEVATILEHAQNAEALRAYLDRFEGFVTG